LQCTGETLNIDGAWPTVSKIGPFVNNDRRAKDSAGNGMDSVGLQKPLAIFRPYV